MGNTKSGNTIRGKMNKEGGRESGAKEAMNAKDRVLEKRDIRSMRRERL